MDADAILKKAKEVISIEIEGLEALKNNLNEDFVKLAQACCETLDKGGKIVITGIGKSGHVGSKIAATMAANITTRHISSALFTALKKLPFSFFIYRHLLKKYEGNFDCPQSKIASLLRYSSKPLVHNFITDFIAHPVVYRS